ncbi:MAG: hypothetical protein ACRETD_01860 [Steroidobacteraceae bacterium]
MEFVLRLNGALDLEQSLHYRRLSLDFGNALSSGGPVWRNGSARRCGLEIPLAIT